MKRMIYEGYYFLENKDYDSLKILIEKASGAVKLHLIGQYLYHTENYPVSKEKLRILALELLKDVYQKKTCFDDKKLSVHLSMLGLSYSGLKLVNMFLKEDQISKALKGMKQYAYDHMVLGGTLMSDIDKEEIRFDGLLSCVPFGLFEPEDLVLVEAVKVLKEKQETDEDMLLLAWYLVEQGSYAFSRELIKNTEDCSLLKLIKLKLEKLNQLKEVFILHEPYGNGNIYEPQLYERFPKEPVLGEAIIINAISVPDEKILLRIDGRIYDGEYKHGVWCFTVPDIDKPGTYEYDFKFENRETASDKYVVIVGEKKIFEAKKLYRKQNELIITDGYVDIHFKPDDDHVKFSVNDASNRYGWSEVVEGIVYSEIGIVVNKEPFQFHITQHGKSVLSLIENGLTYKINQAGIYEVEMNTTRNDEMFYGFGERYNEFSQKTGFIDQYVYNQYKDQGIRTYIPMPICYSNKGYGIYLDHENYTYFDINKELKFGAEDNHLKGRILLGGIKDQVHQFYQMMGPAKMVPDWALGPWMSSNNWDSEAEVRKQVELTKKYDIPSTVLVIEAWSDEATFYIFNDAEYEEKSDGLAHTYEDFNFPEWGRWPDPKGMINYLHEEGLKCILWQIPIIKQITSLVHRQKSLDEGHMLLNDYAVTHPDGSPYRLPEGWFKDSLLMDFSNPEGRKWWFDKRQYLLDIGVDGFKTDGGEFVFGKELAFSDGRTGKAMRNAYPNDYVKAYYDFSQENEGITFSRAGYTGLQQFPAHWAGDERSTFEAFRRSILAGLSSALSGVIFWGWDLGGFSGDIPSAELYIRSTQMATFCPIMQYHAESKGEFNQDRTPWNIAKRHDAPEVIDIYRDYAKLRMSLIPYLLEESKRSVNLGVPFMRPLIYDYEEDLLTHELWDEFMLGECLLIAPVITKGAVSRIVYLPRGNWYHMFEEKWYTGNETYDVKAELHEIPVFIKEDSVIPLTNKLWLVGDNINYENDDVTVSVKDNEVLVESEEDFEVLHVSRNKS